MGNLISFDKFDEEKIKDILSMEKPPEKQAEYLIRQYEGEAGTMADNYVTILLDMEELDAAQYWQMVHGYIKAMTTRH